MRTKHSTRLSTYLATAVGIGCTASIAKGAVTFYGINSANDTNPDPAGIDFGFSGFDGFVDVTGSTNSFFAEGSGPTTLFTSGTALNMISSSSSMAKYVSAGSTFVYGAMAGADNYANVSFNGDDGVYESVAQFFFDGTGGGYLIAIATNDNPANPLPIPDGVDMIDNVPEPSSLALLALGAGGLATRRQRRK